MVNELIINSWLCQKIDDYAKNLFLILIVYVDTNSSLEIYKVKFYSGKGLYF